MRFLVLLSALATIPAAPGAEIVAAVTGPRIKAREIAAALEGWRPASPQADLAPSPPPGSPRRISRALLESWTHAAGADASALPDSLLIERKIVRLTPASAGEVVRSAVAEKVELDPAAIEVRVPADQDFPAPPAGNLAWSLIGRPPDSPNEAAGLRLRWIDAAGRSGIELIRAQVRARGEWLVAVRDLSAREPVDAADFRLEQGFLPSLDCSYLTHLEPDQRFELKQHLKSGAALESNLLRRRPDVARGDVLQLVARTGPVALRAPVRAESAGEIGESIRLKNLATGRVIVGRIVSPETAEVELP